MIKITCPQCGGDGCFEYYETAEDNPFHTCYRCNAEGVIVVDENDDNFLDVINSELRLAAQCDVG